MFDLVFVGGYFVFLNSFVLMICVVCFVFAFCLFVVWFVYVSVDMYVHCSGVFCSCCVVLLPGVCVLSSFKHGLFCSCVFVDSACCCIVGGGSLFLLSLSMCEVCVVCVLLFLVI